MTEATKKTTSKRPVRTVRSGSIGASIWQETGAEGAEYLAITLSRSWKSKNTGKDGYSNKFFARNEADILETVRLACQAARELETTDTTSA